MITAAMITEYLKDIAVTDICLKKNDPVTSVRIMEKDLAPEEHTLYLSTDGGDIRCRTAGGSSFTASGAELFRVLNRILEALDYYNTWEKQMQDACERGCTLTELLDLSYPVLPHPVFILDANEWAIAWTSAFTNQKINPDWDSIVENRTSDSAKISVYNMQYYHFFQKKSIYRIQGNIFSGSGHAFNLFHGSTFCGVMCLLDYPEPATAGSLDAFRMLGDRIHTLINNASSNFSFCLPEKTFLDFLAQPLDDAQLARFLHLAGWADDDPKKLLFAVPCSSGSLAPSPFHSRIMFSRMDGVLSANYQNGLVLLCNLRILSWHTPASFSQWLARISYHAGMSDTFSLLSDLPRMFHQAYTAMQYGQQENGSVNSFRDYVIPYLVSLLREKDPEILTHSWLNRLRQHDKRYGSNLYDTLFVYLKHERKIAETAAELGLHRSTLIHRLQRLSDILGDALEQPETRLHLLLCYYAQDTR